MDSLATTHEAWSDAGIDRKALRQIVDRFRRVNDARLARYRDSRNERQRQILDVLPLLFHLNHPLLPGFVAAQAPFGVAGYQPSRDTLSTAQQLSRSFKYNPVAENQRDIDALYLMGSVGSFACNSSSDLDIWLCHRPGLATEAIVQLRSKAERISRWAADVDLELHFFVFDCDSFRRGEHSELSSESCGSAQHGLLLDEFYRTGLLLAGCYPIWWLTPPNLEEHHDRCAAWLKERRFIDTKEVIDFGAVGAIAPEEFLGAGVWQLFKSIDSPYKSVLKLLLVECYASQYPATRALALDYKQAIYAGKSDADQLDPYVFLYQRLEAYLLERADAERIELIRRCLYNKAEGGGNGWRRALMQKLTSDWGWNPIQISSLSRQQWSVDRTIEEWRRLVVELTFCYRFLSRFSRDQQLTSSMDAQELKVLGRKLNATFERRPGKVDLQPASLLLATAPRLHFSLRKAEKSEAAWALFDQVDLIPQIPIRQARHLGELIAWAHFNLLAGRSSRITSSVEISERTLQRLFAELERWQPVPLPPIAHEAFENSQQPVACMVVINLDAGPLSSLEAAGLARLSNRSDALGYSGLRQNLVRAIDTITLTSWGEVLTQRHVGNAALVNTLVEHLNGFGMASHMLPPPPTLSCLTEGMELIITERIEQCFTAVRLHFSPDQSSHPARYLLEIEKELYLLEWERERVVQRRFDSPGALLSHLATPATEFRTLRIDPLSLTRHDLHLIAELNQPNRIELFYRQEDGRIRIYITDEQGAIFALSRTSSDPRQAISPWLTFIERIGERRQHNGLPAPDLRCFELVGRDPVAELRSLSSLDARLSYRSVEALAEPGSDEAPRFSFRVGEEEFSSLQHGESLYSKVAQALLNQRRGGERYPAHLADLDLTALGSEPAPTALYLYYKARIETAISQALISL